MLISRETLDDVLLELYPKLLQQSGTVVATRGEMAETIGALIEIAKPRARLSRSETRGKLFSSIGELLWYLTRDNQLDFIEGYLSQYREESEDGVTVYGGYGPRLFNQRGNDQIKNVIDLLKVRSTSRRAVVQLFNAEDIAEKHNEIPCTTMQFLVRDQRLDLVVTMRSNDAYIGLPHDVFCFHDASGINRSHAQSRDGELPPFRGEPSLVSREIGKARSSLLTRATNSGSRCRKCRTAIRGPRSLSYYKLRRASAAETKWTLRALGLADYWSDLVRLLQIHFSTVDTEKKTLLDKIDIPTVSGLNFVSHGVPQRMVATPQRCRFFRSPISSC